MLRYEPLLGDSKMTTASASLEKLNRARADESHSAWILAAAVPVAVLLLGLWHPRLWLTMPADPQSQLVQWVLSAEAVVWMALGSGPTVQGFISRLSASIAILTLAWAAADAPLRELAEAATFASLGAAFIVVVEQKASTYCLTVRATLIVTITYLILA